MRICLPQALASISGSGCSRGLSLFSSEESSSSSPVNDDFLTRTTDSMVFFVACSSNVFTLSWRYFKYLIASPKTDVLSVCMQKK